MTTLGNSLLVGSITDEPARCLERMSDGWAWRQTPDRVARVLLAIGIALIALPGLLLLTVSVLAMFDDELMWRGPLFALGLGVSALAAYAVASTLRRLVPWQQVVFHVDAPSPQVRLSRGSRQRVLSLGELRAVHVIHARPIDGGFMDTYLGLRVAGRRRTLIVGRRAFQPAAAVELRAILPASVDVQTPKWA
jgi:hypothetical protein